MISKCSVLYYSSTCTLQHLLSIHMHRSQNTILCLHRSQSALFSIIYFPILTLKHYIFCHSSTYIDLKAFCFLLSIRLHRYRNIVSLLIHPSIYISKHFIFYHISTYIVLKALHHLPFICLQ